MIRWALPASVALHLAAAALLLPRPGRPLPSAQDVPAIEVELVEQPDAQAGAAAQEGEAQPPPAPPREAPAPPGPDAAPQPSPATPPARPRATAVNLGDAAQDLEGLSVTGDNVVPPAPDALFRNRPPAYPREAGRRGAHGTVGLLIHVSAEGAPESVLVASSSGTESLDRAARDAVLLWRFNPARADGVPVPYDYQLNIRFVAGGRR